MFMRYHLLVVFFVLLTGISLAENCIVNIPCTIGDTLLNDSNDVEIDDATCSFTLKNPDGSINYQGTPEQNGAYYYKNFTFSEEKGIYSARMSCTTPYQEDEIGFRFSVEDRVTQPNITDVLNRLSNLSTQENVTKIIAFIEANTTSLSLRFKDNIESKFRISQADDNSSPIFSVMILNNSIIKSLDYFDVIIYNASGIEEQRKNITTFNNIASIYWQIFSLTRHGQYRAELNGTYNGIEIRDSLPFSVASSSSIQYDVSLSCPDTATYGENITCTAAFQRLGEAGDTIYEYYLEGNPANSESFYQTNGNITTKQLTLNVNKYGTVRFIVNVLSPYATASDTFFVEGGIPTATLGGSSLASRGFLYVNKIAKQYWWAVAMIFATITIVIISVRRNAKN